MCKLFLNKNIFLLILTCSVSLFAACNSSEELPPKILVNNLGYELESPKTAFITDIDADSFYVLDENNELVLKKKINGLSEYDPSSGDYVREVSFDEVNRAGTYYIKLDTDGERNTSHQFRIEDDIFATPTFLTLRGFYLHRCGIEVIDKNYGHPACHINDAVYFDNPDVHKNVTGGWHDAGDYNKFSVTHNVSLGYLLQQYLESPKAYTDGQLSIPESGNGIPDILDEIKWGIEWLLKIQDKNGGVYHKVSIKKWTGEHLPHQETDQRYIFKVSSTGTAGAIAVFALGYQVFKKFDHDFAEELKQAALKGWQFLEANPVTVPLGGFSNPPDVYGGGYGDNIDIDERLWAAVELYKVTREKKYLDYFHVNYKKFWNESFYVISWKDLRNFAFYSYLNLDKNDINIDKNVYSDLESLHKSYIDRLLKNIEDSKYDYVLRQEEFYWGSNSVALGYAYDLIQAYKLTKDQKYFEAALSQLNYILGKNPLGISFVTGVGSNSVNNPYHQFSYKDENELPVPGMMVGGANYYTHYKNKKISEFTAKNYVDYFKNFMVNEPAINYTASLSYVTGFINNEL